MSSLTFPKQVHTGWPEWGWPGAREREGEVPPLLRCSLHHSQRTKRPDPGRASSSDWGWLPKIPVISRIIMLMSLCSVCERPLGFQKCPLSAVYLHQEGVKNFKLGASRRFTQGGIRQTSCHTHQRYALSLEGTCFLLALETCWSLVWDYLYR